jgi:site-specific DNA-methyltransferase (adenine-specific)
MKVTNKITITNEDNMALMARYPDNYFDLAIVDPPYGINFGEFNRTNKDSNGVRYKANKYKQDEWDDSIPNDEYFKELFRVSKNQIVWGGNYFPYLWKNGCKGFIFWYKHQPVDNFSKGELAWTSFNKPANCFDFQYYGGLQGNTKAESKIHPTQKPKELYKWLLDKYAKDVKCTYCNNGRVIDDDYDRSTIPCELCNGTMKIKPKILDTHLGSGSIAIACHDYGFELTACELDSEYYEKAIQRIKNHTNQQKLF